MSERLLHCFTYNHTSFLLQTFLDGKVLQLAYYNVALLALSDSFNVGNGQAITKIDSEVITVMFTLVYVRHSVKPLVMSRVCVRM